MQIIDNEGLPALEGNIGDINVFASGAYDKNHRMVYISQPGIDEGEEDIIMVCTHSQLSSLIEALQKVEKHYFDNPGV